MTAPVWHPDPPLLVRYASTNDVDEAHAYSLEAHLMSCEHCRRAVADVVSPGPIDDVWARVSERVDAPTPGPVERLLLALGIPDHAARLLAATRSLRLSWFAAMAFALGFAVAAAYAGGTSRVGLLVFLVVAPLLPLAGVAAAYGPGIDPTYEIGLASPMRSHRLLFIRAAAVLCTSVIVAGLAALALPRLDWTAAAWLLPSIGLSVTSLALSSFWRPVWASGAVAFVWIAGVVGAELVGHHQLAAFRGSGQLTFLVVLVAALVVLVARRESFDVRSVT
jgi:hypothetical protein